MATVCYNYIQCLLRGVAHHIWMKHLHPVAHLRLLVTTQFSCSNFLSHDRFSLCSHLFKTQAIASWSRYGSTCDHTNFISKFPDPRLIVPLILPICSRLMRPKSASMHVRIYCTAKLYLHQTGPTHTIQYKFFPPVVWNIFGNLLRFPCVELAFAIFPVSWTPWILTLEMCLQCYPSQYLVYLMLNLGFRKVTSLKHCVLIEIMSIKREKNLMLVFVKRSIKIGENLVNLMT